MQIFKRAAAIIFLFVIFGIAGNMDYADKMAAKYSGKNCTVYKLGEVRY